MAEPEEKKPFEQAVRSWQDLSGGMIRSVGRLAEAWAAAHTEFLTGAIRASADVAVDLSESLAAVPSRRKSADDSGKSGLTHNIENGVEDLVNTADAVAHSFANGMEQGAKVVTGAWDVFANHYREKRSNIDLVVE